MKKFIALFLIVFFATIILRAQTTFIAVATGNWNASGIWSTDGFTPITCGPCTAGVDYPGSTDDAFTNGFQITVSGAQNCRDLFVEDVSSSLIFPGQITVNGVMTGWSGGQFGFPVDLTNNVLSGNSVFIFTAADLSNAGNFNYFNNEVLGSWNNNSPITVARFNLSNPGTIDTGFGGGSLRFTSQMVILAGSLSTSFNLNSIEVGNVLAMNPTTTFNTTVPVYGVSGISSNIGQVQVQSGSTLSLSTSNSYINANTFNINGTGTLNVSFSGVNQTEGWWYQISAPSTFNISSTSTINFSASADQNIPALTIGNLGLSGSGSKTLGSSGTLKLQGNLSLSSASITFVSSTNLNPIDIGGNIDNDGVWAPTQDVNFNGSSAQSIGGNNMITFGSGITLINTAGISLLNQDIDINGPLTIDASVNFNPSGRQVNLGGNLVNSGTLTASGTFDFDGTTTVSGSGTNAFQNVTISGSVSAQGKTASISGNFINNGTLDNLNGTVDFNSSSSNQSISGSSTTNFYNLNISNGAATVSNNGTVNLMNAMTLSSGATFDADGSGGSGIFTIVSTSGSNTARINAIPSGASVTGNVVVQRYFDGVGDVWRNLGTPINGATVSQITGAGFTINGNDLAYYDESVTGGVDNGWVLQSTFGSSISNSRGYSMWTRTEEMPVTINFTGTMNQQTQSMPLTYTNSGSPTDDGWNLINNPFPSTVDWDLMTRNGSVSGTVAVWNTSTASYDYWNGSAGNLTNGLIASGQALWVQANGAGPTLSIPESAKVTSSASFLKIGDESAENVLIVALAKSDTVDRTYIQFREDATDAFDPTSDGRKISNGTFGIFNLFSLGTDSNELAINSLPGLTDCQKTVALGFYQMFWDEVNKVPYRGFVPGEYRLNFSGFESFTNSLNFDLVDYYQGNEVITPITSDFVYTFLVDTTQVNSWGDSRFEIRVSEKPIESSVSYNTTSLCDEGTSVNFTNTQAGVEYILQKDGENIVSDISDGADISLFIPSIYMVEGQNEFDVLLKNGECSSVLLNGEVTFNQNSILEVSSVENGKNCGPGRVLVTASGASGNAYYNWYESIDGAEPIAGQNGNEYLTPELETTKYYYVNIVNSEGCESLDRVKVAAEIVNLKQPEISVEGDVLSTQALADGYQWYKDGEALSEETEPSLTVGESGIYSVEILSNGCSSFSENVTMEILGLDELYKMGVSIYPNPVSSVLNINSEILDIEAIRIFDLKGVMVFEFVDYVPNQIDLTGVKKGIYIVNIATTDQIINYRVKKK